jgi:hypothetical protein
MRWFAAVVCFWLAGCAAVVAPPKASDDGWHAFVLPGKRATQYTPGWQGGQAVVQADADSAASMWRRSVMVEPSELGRMRFSWRVGALIPTADLTDRDSEDSPVRIVLAFDGDHATLSPRNRMLFELAQAVTGEPPPYATLMYVWDNAAPLESVIPGNRTDRIRKIVVDSGAAQLGVWRLHERDLAADYRRAFGEPPGRLIGVALMTDSDNTRSQVRAWYRDVQLLGVDGMQR